MIRDKSIDSAQDKCGVFGAVSKNGTRRDIAQVAYTALFQLQHRGQESAGITIFNQGALWTHKEMGTVDWVFRKRIPPNRLVNFILNQKHLPQDEIANALGEWQEEQFNADKRNMPNIVATPLDNVSGSAAIGHVRYSTTGESGYKNIHPIEFPQGAVAHNGNLVGLDQLRRILNKRGGYTPRGDTDTALIAALIASSSAPNFEEAIQETLHLLKGAFSLVVIHKGAVYAATDRFGIRPVCLGENNQYWFVASESCALDGLKAKFSGELPPGHLVIMPQGEMPVIKQWTDSTAYHSCIFEHIYLSRPDSLLRGKRVSHARQAMGRELAREHPIENIDLVISVPDSGTDAAMGYAKELSRLLGREVPYARGLIRGRVGRTFMDPIEKQRYLLQALKHNPVPEDIRGKRVGVVDDSIVRGNASAALMEKLRFFGARKVVFLSASPPLRYPCFLGVDLPRSEDYVAHNRSVEEIRQKIGADYLGYLSLEGLYRAISLTRSTFCDGCLTNQYPVSP